MGRTEQSDNAEFNWRFIPLIHSLNVAAETEKEMHVIRHDHVTTDNYSEFRRMMAILDESSVNRGCS